MALDSGDSPRIAFFESEFGILKHAQRGKIGWSIYSVDTASGIGWFPSLDIDSMSNSHISYADVVSGSLEYAIGKDDTWSKETVDSGGVGRYTSIVVDSDDTPHISYVDYTKNRLKYAGVVGKVYDFAIVGAVLSKNIVGQGYNVIVNSTLLNNGSNIETLNLTLYANKTFAMSRSFSVEPGEPITANLIWSTGSITKGDFNIEVTIAIHPCEINIEDNSFTAGSLMVTIPGDVDGDKDVDIFDIVRMAAIYGVTALDKNYDPNCDIDGDDDIDIFDIVAAASHYGENW